MTSLFMLANAWTSFIELFTGMSAVVAILFILGIVMCVVEIFMPGFGVFGIGGIVCMALAILLRMLDGGNGWMLFYMLLIGVIVCVICFFVLSRLANKGKMKGGMFTVDSSVPTTRTEGTGDFEYLLGQQGVTVNALRPVGKARFGTDTVEVVSSSLFIDADTKVKVVKVEGNVVTVQPIKK